MASTYLTEHYGLSQWEPGDSFIRADFNQDNQKLDRAVRRAEDKAERALDGLVPVSYNVFQIILQSYYDRKQTGFKKALVFDGFLDGGMIASLSGGLARTEGCLTLQASGMGDLDLGYGSGSGYIASTAQQTATGNAVLTGFRCRVYADMEVHLETVLKYTVRVNGAAVSSGTYQTRVIPAHTTAEISFDFATAPGIKKGDTFMLSIETSGSGYLLSYMSGGLGGTFRITSVTGQTGRMTGSAARLPECGALRAWVRHKNGAVAFSVRDGNGRVRTFALESQRTVVEPKGHTCTESAFWLDGGLPEGNSAILLDASLNGAAEMDVYDYGVVLT